MGAITTHGLTSEDYNWSPTEHDYARLRRALIGLLVIMLAFIITGFAIQITWSTLIVEGLFCLLYCSVPILCIVALCRCPFTPQSDPSHKRYIKGATNGRRLCFWSGVSCIVVGTWAFLSMDLQFPLYFAWFTLFGLLTSVWSYQFPQVPLSDRQNTKRWQFSLRTLLVITLIVGLYMGSVVLWSEPGDALGWRLIKPIVAISAFCFFGSLIVKVVLCIRWVFVPLIRVGRVLIFGQEHVG